MKYNKRKFQTILSSDKVNFRGHQKALMRIMDGTSRKLDYKKAKDEIREKFQDKQAEADLAEQHMRRQRSLRQ